MEYTFIKAACFYKNVYHHRCLVTHMMIRRTALLKNTYDELLLSLPLPHFVNNRLAPLLHCHSITPNSNLVSEDCLFSFFTDTLSPILHTKLVFSGNNGEGVSLFSFFNF